MCKLGQKVWENMQFCQIRPFWKYLHNFQFDISPLESSFSLVSLIKSTQIVVIYALFLG